ncbi:MAG: ATP-binding cassette domain-containing protein [Gammaproteobacteria bacterium]|nr:ATP-binding cassette domain-containing protein [Gammaproteobacteria bacterium]
MSFIHIKNLTKKHANRRSKNRSPGIALQPNEMLTVLDDINLEIEEGEMVCVIGPSGCGKSTLLRIIAGFDLDYEGEVTIDAEKVDGPSSEHIFVFQQNGLLPWMTVWENIELGLRNIEDIDKKNDQIQEYIDLVELNGFEHYLSTELSGGMQRRTEIARALAVKPDILYLDEPFTGLDYFTHLKIREEVVNIHEYIGKTMIMVTHFIEDALVMADRIVVLSDLPTKVKMTQKLEFSRPRNINKNREMGDLRDEIFLMLGVSYVA